MKRLGTFVASAGFMLAAAISSSWAQAPESRLLVLSKAEGTLAVIDPSSLKALATVPVGTNPHEVTASPDGRRAYVSNYANGSQNTITVVDLERRERLTTIDLGPLYGPHGLTYVGGHPWFTAEREKLIGRLDPATNKVDWELGTGQTGTHLLWVSRDTHRIVTVNAGSGTLSLIQQRPVVSAEEAKKIPYSKYGGQTTRGTNGAPLLTGMRVSFLSEGIRRRSTCCMMLPVIRRSCGRENMTTALSLSWTSPRKKLWIRFR